MFIVLDVRDGTESKYSSIVFLSIYLYAKFGENKLDPRENFANLQHLIISFCIFAAAPKITHAPKNMRVAEDLIVSFFCKATGYPPPTFHWEKKGKKLTTRKLLRYEVISMPNGSVLRIEPTKKRKDSHTFT